MLKCEHGTYRYSSSGGDPGKPKGFCQGHSWGLDGFENRCPSFNRRRAETWLDGAGLGADAHEPKSLDSGGKCRRVKRPEEQAQTRAAFSYDAPNCPGSGRSFGAISPEFWPEPGSLGRAHAGRALKTPVRIKDESAASSDLDASTGISFKEGQLCVPSSAGDRCEAISSGVKKNFKIWGLGRRWSSRMRRDLRSTRDWDEDGQREDILIASRRPANISNASIFRAGWPRFWAVMELFGQTVEIEKAS